MKRKVNRQEQIEILIDENKLKALMEEQIRRQNLFDEFIRNPLMQTIIEQMFGTDAKNEVLQHIKKE